MPLDSKLTCYREMSELPNQADQFLNHLIVAEGILKSVWGKSGLPHRVAPSTPMSPPPFRIPYPGFSLKTIPSERHSTVSLCGTAYLIEDVLPTHAPTSYSVKGPPTAAHFFMLFAS